MMKLKLGPIADDKPVRITVELPAQVHRNLLAYAEALGRETGSNTAVEVAKLIAPMLSKFMTTDRAFSAARRVHPPLLTRSAPSREPESSGERVTDSESA